MMAYLYCIIGMYISNTLLHLCFLLILMFSVHMWGYLHHAYVHRSNVSVPWDQGITGWYQSLGSHIFSTTSRHINVKLIYNWSAWFLVIHSNRMYKVICSFLILFPLNPKILPSFHFSFLLFLYLLKYGETWKSWRFWLFSGWFLWK